MPTLSPSDLTGLVCLITGGAGLLGRQFARACVEHGATVVLLDVNTAALKTVAEQLQVDIGSTADIRRCDITNTAEVKLVVQSIKRRYGRIDALVNSAYPRNRHFGRPFEAVTYHDFCDNINQHLGGYFLMTQAVTAVMRRQKTGGRVVNLGSIYGFAAPRFDLYRGTPMTVAVEYPAIKGGIITLTRYLASYLGKDNIRVNCISPGGVWEHQPKQFVRRYAKKVVLGSRMATPEDISGVLVFLLSDAARYLTGQNIVVDGGWSL